MKMDNFFHGHTDTQSKQAMASFTSCEASDHSSRSSASRNPRQPPEESGPFGRNRTNRYTGSRTSRTRTGTTPVRQKEDPTVAAFGRLFAKEQAKEEEERAKSTLPAPTTTSGAQDAARTVEPEAVATECLLYGYASKTVEWKVLSKFERIVAPSIICEDYPREDPDLFLSSTSVYGHSRSAIVVHKNLSKDALKKARMYRGGNHWIKVTFDSYQAAERACFYSPVEIDGHLVFCEMWQGRGPFSDAPLLKGTPSAMEIERNAGSKMRTLTTAQTTTFRSGIDSAVSGFERAVQTLPRGFNAPAAQYAQPSSFDDASISSSTASSATATEMQSPTPHPASGLRSRSVPNLPLQPSTPNNPTALRHIPSAKRMVLRPISEALPPQPTFTERVMRSLPIFSWFVGNMHADANGEPILDGPILKEDGTWDANKNGLYYTFMHNIDSLLGTDLCGIRDEVDADGVVAAQPKVGAAVRY